MNQDKKTIFKKLSDRFFGRKVSGSHLILSQFDIWTGEQTWSVWAALQRLINCTSTSTKDFEMHIYKFLIKIIHVDNFRFPFAHLWNCVHASRTFSECHYQHFFRHFPSLDDVSFFLTSNCCGCCLVFSFNLHVSRVSYEPNQVQSQV
jgi:hypothetical protein